ncbi:FkbM family methyltransferase, partial [Trichothermofontia sp.]
YLYIKNESKIMSTFIPSLKHNGYLDQLHFTICNVGSRKLDENDNYGSQGWDIFAPNLTIYGFDADEDACVKANADLKQKNVNWTEKHIPVALSNTIGKTKLYVTESPICSSLYPPNEPLLARFKELPVFMNLDRTIDIETTTLDAFCQNEEIDGFDFLQIDVQGAELKVLEGAIGLLRNSILVLQLEVEFAPLYLHQPLFSDIDKYLRELDFSLFDLYPAYRLRSRSAVMNPKHPGQILWAEAFYLRDLLQTETKFVQSPERLFKLACIADVMNFADYALELLEFLTLNYGEDARYNFANIIVEVLAQLPGMEGQDLERIPIVKSIRNFINLPELPKPKKD